MNSTISELEDVKSVFINPAVDSSLFHEEFHELQVFSLDRSSSCSSESSSSLCSLDDLTDVYKTEMSTLVLGDNDEDSKMIKEEDVADNKKIKKGTFDVNAYADSRLMSPLQEKLNAITVIPNPIFCLFYLLAGKWLTEESISLARMEFLETSDITDWTHSNFSETEPTLLNFLGIDGTRCIHNPLFPSLYAIPPLPVMAVAIGIILHAPFSFIYHWHYTHRLPPGPRRIEHWSRRMDQSFIHVISAFMAYGTSGRWNFFWVNALFNIDCIYRQFKKRVHPRRNKIRILISIIAYTIPIARRGDTVLFCKLWTLLIISGWLFAKYPIRGWSHSAFHMVIALVPPLLMEAACHLTTSEAQIKSAARCAVLRENGLL